jgi:hypothetical protein
MASEVAEGSGIVRSAVGPIVMSLLAEGGDDAEGAVPSPALW